jgi:hypothetical protein
MSVLNFGFINYICLKKESIIARQKKPLLKVEFS